MCLAQKAAALWGSTATAAQSAARRILTATVAKARAPLHHLLAANIDSARGGAAWRWMVFICEFSKGAGQAFWCQRLKKRWLHCSSHFLDKVARGEKGEKRPRPPVVPGASLPVADLVEGDKGRVCWNFPKWSWVAVVQDASGSTRYYSKGLEVPTKGLDGRALDAREYEAARKKVLQKAKALWNEKDCSTRPRYTFEE